MTYAPDAELRKNRQRNRKMGDLVKKIPINIEELANRCGIQIISCDPAFGGRWAYTENPRQGNNQVIICGYRTQKAAIRGWFENEFSSKAGQILLDKYIKPVI